jgi:hypothetical protein
MFLIVAPISFMLTDVGIYILHRTFVPYEIVNTGTTLTYKYSLIEWMAIGGFVSIILAALFTIWYGKKINKDAETKAGEVVPPANP